MLKQESPNPSKKEQNIAKIELLVIIAESLVFANGAAFGRLRNIRKNAVMCITNPPITIGSLPHLTNTAPRIPKQIPPIK